MTKAPSSSKAATAKSQPKKPAPPPPAIKAGAKKSKSFFSEDPAGDFVADEVAAYLEYNKLLKRLFVQTSIIAGLTGFLIFTLPLYQPLYQYIARTPDGHEGLMIGLDMPNMTNQAVISWAISSVTETLTIGFGDFEKKLLKQKPRFTDAGWKSFADAFDNQKTGQTFLKNQLVLTTVPSNTAIIMAEGVNEEKIYQWKVQVPVVMTYATNDNVTRREHAIVTLTIVRVLTQQSPYGIAIKSWD